MEPYTAFKRDLWITTNQIQNLVRLAGIALLAVKIIIILMFLTVRMVRIFNGPQLVELKLMANSNFIDPADEGARSTWHEDLVEYLADPLDKRTFDQFSTDHGISLMTLYRYRKKHRDELSREVESIRRKFLSEFRSKAYKSLYGKIDKDTNALKLFFQLAGDLIERSENKTEILTPEDKKARIQAAIAKLLDEAEGKNGQKESSPETKEPRPE